MKLICKGCPAGLGALNPGLLVPTFKTGALNPVPAGTHLQSWVPVKLKHSKVDVVTTHGTSQDEEARPDAFVPAAK